MLAAHQCGPPFKSDCRCRVDAEWPRHEQEFNKKVEQILADAPRTTIDGVKAYFADNWWCTTWRDLSTDIGLCAGQTRDGLNTNNTIERAFKTFDQVFLACRVNKRIDRLVTILATDWLVYYEHYASQVPRVGKVERDMMLKAHQLWESHAVVCISKKHARYRIIGVSSKRSKHKGERRRSKKSKKSKHRHKQRARDSTETASKRDLPPSNDQVVSLEPANVGWTIITLFVQHIQHQIQSRARLVAGTWLYEPEDSCDDQRLLKKITSWRENEMISTCKRIVFPLNLNNCHWAVGIVDVGTRSIRIVDSMPSQVHHTSFCNFLARFMNGRLAWELERAGQDGTAARARRWITTPQDPVIDTILPRQNDGSSCGLIACKAIEAVLRNKPPTWKSCGLKAQNISLDEANHMRQALFNMTQLYIKPRGL
ncbi:unnamed protein product [Tilletia controversa]|nr:unnamed protein product [Tilletia controversa]